MIEYYLCPRGLCKDTMEQKDPSSTIETICLGWSSGARSLDIMQRKGTLCKRYMEALCADEAGIDIAMIRMTVKHENWKRLIPST